MTTRTYNPHLYNVNGMHYDTNVPHHSYFRPMADLESFGVMQHRKFDDEAYFQRQNIEETQFHGDSMVTKPIEHLRSYSSDTAPRSAPKMVKVPHHLERAQSRQLPFYHNLNEEYYNEASGNIAVRKIVTPEYDYKSRYSTFNMTHTRGDVINDEDRDPYMTRMNHGYSREYKSNAANRKKTHKKMTYTQIMED